MSNTLQPLHHQMRSHVRLVRGWLPMFHIWAAQWILTGMIQWYGSWKLPPWTQPASAMTAALVCIAILLVHGWLPAGERNVSGLRLAALAAVVPFCLAAGSLMLMEYVHAVNPFFMDLFRALLLSCFFSVLGLLLGFELMALGIWLFALSAVTFIRYLGFAPMVLDVMGGLSLAACGWILQNWTRTKAGG
ncbi:hypothetical protein [Gorillibacterium sp. sgz5001074]|uniref:hypothetical protein n=1 Tax=Gorillibacterium sp. sgz5001074 TaxID=3446695 RepID=UPI003F674CC4